MAMSMHLGSGAHMMRLRCVSFGSLVPLMSSSSCLGFQSSAKLICKRIYTRCGRMGFKICAQEGTVAVVEKDETIGFIGEASVEQKLSVVMKFGGSSVASAERMKEVANLILSFPEEKPVIVLSAMGKTTNKLLLAGEKAVSCGLSKVDEIDEFSFIRDLHLRTVDELGVDRSTISGAISSTYYYTSRKS